MTSSCTASMPRSSFEACGLACSSTSASSSGDCHMSRLSLAKPCCVASFGRDIRDSRATSAQRELGHASSGFTGQDATAPGRPPTRRPSAVGGGARESRVHGRELLCLELGVEDRSGKGEVTGLREACSSVSIFVWRVWPSSGVNGRSVVNGRRASGDSRPPTEAERVRSVAIVGMRNAPLARSAFLRKSGRGQEKHIRLRTSPRVRPLRTHSCTHIRPSRACNTGHDQPCVVAFAARACRLTHARAVGVLLYLCALLSCV